MEMRDRVINICSYLRYGRPASVSKSPVLSWVEVIHERPPLEWGRPDAVGSVCAAIEFRTNLRNPGYLPLWEPTGALTVVVYG